MGSPSQSVEKKLMIFDLAVGGHHPSYIRHLVAYWRDEEMKGQLFVVVLPDFLEKYTDVVKVANSSTEFVAISPQESEKLTKAKKSLQRAFVEWEIYCRYASKLQVSHGLLMYFDLLQLPIVLGSESPCPFTGIYFRPTFHYKDFDNYVLTLKDILRGWYQKILISLALRNQQLLGLASLDTYAVPYIQKLSPQGKFVKRLPDPIQPMAVNAFDIQALRRKLNIENERKIFLLFGYMEPRKGTHKALEAISLMSQEDAQKICLLIVGQSNQEYKFVLERLTSKVTSSHPIQIITKHEFVSEEAMQTYFKSADYVLIPYQDHVGMSGVLLHAALAGKPVLASNYGLIAKIVKEHQLGAIVDAKSAAAIACKFKEFIKPDSLITVDTQRTRGFIESHHYAYFAETLLLEK